MDALKKHFKDYVCLLLAASIALTSSPVMAGYDLDFYKVVRIAGETDLPIDARDLEQYQKPWTYDAVRQAAVNEFLINHRAKAVLDAEVKSLSWRTAFMQTLKDHQVDESTIRQFFAETLYLFTLFKRKREVLLNHQYQAWRKAWMRIDYREFKSAEDAIRWSSFIRGLFVNAFLEAGPWSLEEAAAIDKFLAKRPELNEKKWYSNFRTRLRKHFNNKEPLDPTTKARAGLSEMVGYFLGIPVAAFFAYAYYELLRAVGDLIGYSNPEGPALGFFAITLWTLIGAGVFGTSWAATRIGAERSPLLHVSSRKEISDVLRLGPLSCEEIVTGLEETGLQP